MPGGRAVMGGLGLDAKAVGLGESGRGQKAQREAGLRSEARASPQ